MKLTSVQAKAMVTICTNVGTAPVVADMKAHAQTVETRALPPFVRML